ncbi:CaaX protease [Gaeumannomyces tritici R3-111a-1]|uniref:intramembrane prenyl-peptidase Rce1 n=1 Tax=Gaeumannomyces tritici (strain R3-111a-1) TaxID=644352 RepID=J3NKG4_GAET3|nr:CaaX protease [Gaeumannomyces tritici R3-111a-1]EJT81778.1 CaaX protease [Gaeumannomyces tritici R3-111a-1]
MPSIRGIVDRIGKYVHYGAKPEAPPPITTRTAVLLLVAYTVIYVAPFYLSSRTRPSAQLSRDAPSVIKARVASVTLSCIACSAVTFYMVTKDGHVSSEGALHLLGYWPIGLAESARSLFLTALLFLGPLFENIVVEAGWKDWMALRPLYDLFGEWTTWRNIVAGPFTEEVLFRSAGVPLMLLARTSVSKTIFLSPVVFGLAHLHHFYEFRLTHPRVPCVQAALRSVFQFAFTTLFGAYATFLYLRGGSLLAVTLVHAFCNSLGLPRFWGRVRVVTADDPDGERSASPLWTVAYYVLLLAGATLFYRNFWTLTQSQMELISLK